MNCTFPSLAEDQLFPPPRVGTHHPGSQPEPGSPVAPVRGKWSWAGSGRPQTLGKVLHDVQRPEGPRGGASGPGSAAPASSCPARAARAGPPRVKRGPRGAAADPATGSGAQ